MSDLSQTVLLLPFSVTRHAIIIKVQQIATVTAWINVERDGVYLALGIQLPNVLLQFPEGNNRSLSDVNGRVVFGGVVPWSEKVELLASINRIFKRQVNFEMIPLTSSGEVHGSTRLTCSQKTAFKRACLMIMKSLLK